MCRSKRTGKELSSFGSFDEALECAEYKKKKHGLDLYPYECDECGEYHLSPKGRIINIIKEGCNCTDSNRIPKKLYEDYEDAKRAKDIIYEERGIWLGIYKCSERSGYHLTHRHC